MKNKTLAFIKNTAIATAACILTGMGASELASHYITNGDLIGAISTATQFITYFATFVPLHAADNRDVYVKDGRFDKTQFIKDNSKFGAPYLALDAAYIIVRPFLQGHFIKQGLEVTKASRRADLYAMLGYAAISIPMIIPLARASGLIRKNSLESKADKIKPLP